MVPRLRVANGVAEYWVVDLKRRCVEVWRAGAESAEIITAELSWQPVPREAPLQLDLLALFARTFADA